MFLNSSILILKSIKGSFFFPLIKRVIKEIPSVHKLAFAANWVCLLCLIYVFYPEISMIMIGGSIAQLMLTSRAVPFSIDRYEDLSHKMTNVIDSTLNRIELVQIAINKESLGALLKLKAEHNLNIDTSEMEEEYVMLQRQFDEKMKTL